MVSCIAASILGRVTPSSAATKSRAEVTNDLNDSSTPTFVRHLPLSRIDSRWRKTILVDSGGNSFKMDLTAVVAAARTTSPLSMYKSNRTGSEGRRMGAIGAPKMVAKELKARAADSRSKPDFLLVAKPWSVGRTWN